MLAGSPGRLLLHLLYQMTIQQVICSSHTSFVAVTIPHSIRLQLGCWVLGAGCWVLGKASDQGRESMRLSLRIRRDPYV